MIERLTFGTTNEAKVNQIRGVLAPANIMITGVENKEDLPEVIEDGNTAVENARKKALTYAQHLGEVIFSMDNALYLEGLSDDEQPGLHVRRLTGYSDRPTDEEMIEYYSKLVASLGGKINGYWEYGVCIATPDGKYKEAIIRSPRIYVSKPSETILPGYPLESIQIDPESGRYMSELSQEEQDVVWQKVIGKPLLQFVESVDF